MTPVSSVTHQSRIRVAMVTNIPAPYRVPVLNQLARDPSIELHVFYAARLEPGRQWDLPTFEHARTFLRERFFERKGRDPVHSNTDVFAALNAFKPDVVVTTGFNPTHLYAFLYAQLMRCQHVAMTDGTALSEASLSTAHRLIRRVVFGRSRAYVAASAGGRELLRLYGVDDKKIHFAPLCANASVDWSSIIPRVPSVDLIFSGRLIDIKNPLFALSVARGVSRRIGRQVSLAILGSGPLQAALNEEARGCKEEVDLRLVGHVSQVEIPSWFASATVFLFPSSWDPWGVVANEACLAGVPVIVSPHAGVAGELIHDGVNGFVRPLELQSWIDAASMLLSDRELRSRMSGQARLRVQPYSAESAARGLSAAIRMAAGQTIANHANFASSWPD